MIEVTGYPPNFKAIQAAFPEASQSGVVFTYGNKIYNPSRHIISPEIWKHEAVHVAQQEFVGSPVIWWQKYIEDPQFRLSQEIPAHKEEYREACRRVIDRNQRVAALRKIAGRLAGGLYGNLCTLNDAMRYIR